MSETTKTPASATRVDIANHPRLGERVSALTYARQAVSEQGKGFASSSSKVSAPVKHLLKVGDWLLDDTHAETDDDEDPLSGPSAYLSVRRPRVGMDYITREQYAAAFVHALTNQEIPAQHRAVITQVLHDLEYSLIDETRYTATTAQDE